MKAGAGDRMKILLFANTTWYLYNFRLALAKDLRAAGYEVVLAAPRDEYVRNVRDAGFVWREIAITRRGLNPLKELKGFVSVIKLYRSEKPDLCHHFTIKPALFGSIAARLLRIRCVVNAVTGLGYLFMHSSLKDRVLRFLLYPVLRFAFRHPNSYAVFQNESDREAYQLAGIVGEEGTEVIAGSGVSMERFSVVGEAPVSDRIVLIARMLRDKGVLEYIEAVRLLREEGYNGEALLVGGLDDGNPSAIPGNQIMEWQDRGIIRWLGHQDDIPGILASSSVVVLPSYREGLSRVLIEAAASGRPLVAADVPGCREVVHDGVNGYLVPVRDPVSLMKAIRRLVSDREMALRMGKAGREIARREFAVQVVNARTMKLYDRLISE